MAKLAQGLFPFRLAKILQLRFPLLALLQISRIFPGHGCVAKQRLFGRFAATRKNSVERVVILRWNGIELMVVASGADHG